MRNQAVLPVPRAMPLTAKAMPVNTKLLGIVAGIMVAAMIWMIPIAGLPPSGQKALAITTFAVIWWVCGVTHPAYTTLLLFLGYILLLGPVTTPEGTTVDIASQVFRLFSLPLMWLMVGAFLIATAVTRSGLATRVAYIFMTRFGKSYRGIVVLSYVLGFVLSFLIPHPFPRALLIMTMIGPMITAAQAHDQDAAALGFGVFAAATGTSMIVLMGDSVLNVAGVGFAKMPVGFFDWLTYMAVPGIVASLLMLGLHLVVFKQHGTFVVDQERLAVARHQLGPMTRQEKVVLAWVGLALALWSTDGIHHIDPAWIALGVAVGLALPYLGEILTPADLTSGVNWPIVVFVAGALAIGNVGRATGMAQWLASTLLPATPPANPFVFAGMIGGVTMGLHMILGSALACMSVVSPPLVEYAARAGWSPLVPALLVYTAVNMHYLFPFHHVTMLLGAGEVGKYGSREVLKYGLPLTIVCLMVLMLVLVPWWMLIGLIPMP